MKVFHTCFSSVIAAEIWEKMSGWQGIQRRGMSWNEVLAWGITYYNGKNCNAELYRMVLAGSVYHVCVERNERVFRGKERSSAVITRVIVQDIFYRASRKPHLARMLLNYNFYP